MSFDINEIIDIEEIREYIEFRLVDLPAEQRYVIDTDADINNLVIQILDEFSLNETNTIKRAIVNIIKDFVNPSVLSILTEYEENLQESDDIPLNLERDEYSDNFEYLQLEDFEDIGEYSSDNFEEEKDALCETFVFKDDKMKEKYGNILKNKCNEFLNPGRCIKLPRLGNKRLTTIVDIKTPIKSFFETHRYHEDYKSHNFFKFKGQTGIDEGGLTKIYWNEISKKLQSDKIFVNGKINPDFEDFDKYGIDFENYQVKLSFKRPVVNQPPPLDLNALPDPSQLQRQFREPSIIDSIIDREREQTTRDRSRIRNYLDVLIRNDTNIIEEISDLETLISEMYEELKIEPNRNVLNEILQNILQVLPRNMQTSTIRNYLNQGDDRSDSISIYNYIKLNIRNENVENLDVRSFLNQWNNSIRVNTELNSAIRFYLNRPNINARIKEKLLEYLLEEYRSIKAGAI